MSKGDISVFAPERDVLKAASRRIQSSIRRTPVQTSSWFNARYGTELFFKCENFQVTGSFKARGAAHAVLSLSDSAARKGVATHSSGNHAAALARAAGLRNIPAYIVMPENAPKVKIEAVKTYGGIIRFCEPTLEARETGLQQLVEETSATFIPPFNHTDIILGQASAALELLEDVPDLDVIIAPVGGGGLLSGTALAAKRINPGITVYGAEPEQANDAFLSLRAGHIIPAQPDTIADGLRTSLGDITFGVIRRFCDEILTVPEDAIITSMRDVWERMKIIIEPSCSVPVAAIGLYPDLFAGKKTGVILTGGNVDLDKLPWM
ncbi:threonine dehydratase [Cyclonatronum proteinivorum]|uniref:Threonine dehydratase n=1 Tax=Cyclonatronum proteinivorum TaxID=1457365 RepID=A0A345UGU8_9BACT|nr:pyridoxal-phosphate dependent enzyme [Cyclonatronum proteinivorum]AXI99699.1 threonine dehydratase [Cyclonatronum proteinivorum]